jgi:predicted phage tail protein
MEDNLVQINFHGDAGQFLGKQWEIAGKTVSECLRGVEAGSKKLYKYLLEKEKENAKYEIIINGHEYIDGSKMDINNLETIKYSEFNLKRKLKTIDVVPVLEGAGRGALAALLILVAVVLIILDLAVFHTGYLTAVGVGLIIAGIGILLTKPPKIEDFREIEQGGKTSYLFSGPENVVGEGGPVPLVYGQILVGSQVITSAYVVRDYAIQPPEATVGGDGFWAPRNKFLGAKN